MRGLGLKVKDLDGLQQDEFWNLPDPIKFAITTLVRFLPSYKRDLCMPVAPTLEGLFLPFHILY